MTVKINNTLERKCYNSESMKSALEHAIQRRKARTSTKQDDSAIIRELGRLRNAEHLAELWIANGMGSVSQFLESLGANARRLHDLFGNGPIR